MFTKKSFYVGALFIVSATILATPSLVLAQHGGGHGGGGFDGGGGFSGGHFSGGHFGGGEFRPYRPDYGIYGYPYYGTYGNDTYAPYYYGAPYTSYYDPGYYDTYAPSTDNMAHLTVNVPADARIFVDGNPTTSTGPVRHFHSPPLAPGRNYTYTLEARWNDNGHAVTQTQKVDVAAGSNRSLTFQAPHESATQTSKAVSQQAAPTAR